MLLKTKYFSNNLIKYLLISDNFEELKTITKDLNKDPRVIDYQLNQ